MSREKEKISTEINADDDYCSIFASQSEIAGGWWLWLLAINNDNVDDNDDADAKGASVATTGGLSPQRSIACNP